MSAGRVRFTVEALAVDGRVGPDPRALARALATRLAETVRSGGLPAAGAHRRLRVRGSRDAGAVAAAIVGELQRGRNR